MKYKDAGVDVQRGYAAVDKIKEIVKSTFDSNVLTGIGDFGASYAIPGDENNILVSGADGVGTKLKLAFQTDRHNTIGQDCVAMCVNDILASGAKPLFFLDYLATGKIEQEKVAEIVSGIADGCKKAGAALIGGETAEMPGFYKKGEYDLAGFSVGIVNKKGETGFTTYRGKSLPNGKGRTPLRCKYIASSKGNKWLWRPRRNEKYGILQTGFRSLSI